MEQYRILVFHAGLCQYPTMNDLHLRDESGENILTFQTSIEAYDYYDKISEADKLDDVYYYQIISI